MHPVASNQPSGPGPEPQPALPHPNPPRDEVDQIVQAWAAQRSDLDTSPMQVFSRITRLSRHLDFARREAFAAHGLETWEFDVLSSLRRAGAPYQLTPGRLMAESMVSSGTMTNRLDRLQAKGLIHRTPSETDGRVVIVALTEEGKNMADGALAALLQAEQVFLQGMSNSDRIQLAALLRQVILPFEQHG